MDSCCQFPCTQRSRAGFALLETVRKLLEVQHDSDSSKRYIGNNNEGEDTGGEDSLVVTIPGKLQA